MAKLTDLHPRAATLIYGSGDVKALSELLSEGLASLSEANLGLKIITEKHEDVPRVTTLSEITPDVISERPFYGVGIIVFSYVNATDLADIREFPHVIEHNQYNPEGDDDGA